MPTPPSLPEDTLPADVLARALKAGASAADVILVRSTALSVTLRHGQVELLERSEAAEIGLRVFKGQQQAMVAASDLRPENLAELTARALEMAAATPADPYAGLADPGRLVRDIPVLDMAEPAEPSSAALIKVAGEAEAAALAVAGVTNSDAAEASWSRSEVFLAASNGFSNRYARTSANLSVSVLAGTGTGMQTDYDYDSAVYWSDLRDPATVGRAAGERAVRALEPRRIGSQQVPVIYEAREARDMVRHFLAAINGASIARKGSFLQDRMGQAVFSPAINIEEDPFLSRAPASRPFDGEGLAPFRGRLVEGGVLRSWLLNLSTARQLGLSPTGHATRGLAGPPGASASNVWLEAGRATVEEMIADIKQGLYLTGALGHGTDMVTGDYSRGARGFWIENGRIAYPVNEITVAGNLADIFRTLVPASDLNRRFGVESPSLLIPSLTVAGQ